MEKCVPKMLDIGCVMNQKHVQYNISECGETGRHKRLKISRYNGVPVRFRPLVPTLE